MSRSRRNKGRGRLRTDPEYDPGPCPVCGAGNTAELGQYMGLPCMTIIYCRVCNFTVTGNAETIAESMELARTEWEKQRKPFWEEDDRSGTGLLDED